MLEVLIMSSVAARRDWLEQALGAEPSFHVAGAAGTFPLLRSMLNEIAADAVIVDMTSVQSETAHDWLLEILDVVPLIVLGSEFDESTFNSMLHAESGALLRPDASPEQIIRAVQAASTGLLAFDASMISHAESDDTAHEELTPREIDVLRLLAEGHGNREIASRLGISEHTIKFHIRSVMAKLGAATRTEAVTRGFRTGLIEL